MLSSRDLRIGIRRKRPSLVLEFNLISGLRVKWPKACRSLRPGMEKRTVAKAPTMSRCIRCGSYSTTMCEACQSFFRTLSLSVQRSGSPSPALNRAGTSSKSSQTKSEPARDQRSERRSCARTATHGRSLASGSIEKPGGSPATIASKRK